MESALRRDRNRHKSSYLEHVEPHSGLALALNNRDVVKQVVVAQVRSIRVTVLIGQPLAVYQGWIGLVVAQQEPAQKTVKHLHRASQSNHN